MYVYKSKVKTSAHNVYDALLDTLVAEYEQKTGKKISREKMEQGIKYKQLKKEGKNFDTASIHIKKPTKDKLLLSTYSYKGTTYEMRYDIVAIDEESCEVTYTQSSNPETNINSFQKFMTDRNMKDRFKKIVQYVKDKEAGKYDDYFKKHEEELNAKAGEVETSEEFEEIEANSEEEIGE